MILSELPFCGFFNCGHDLWNRNFLSSVILCFIFNLRGLLLAFLSCLPLQCIGVTTGKQEYSSRTLGATWGIISAIMVPIVIVLICIGWRILLRRKQDEKDDNDFSAIRTRTLDPDESMKINSDDDSIPYKKDIEDSPEPTDPVRVVDNENQGYQQGYPYGDPEVPPTQPMMSPGQPMMLQAQPMMPPPQGRNWGGETEIN